MRKIYYTKELLAAKLLYPFRRQWVRLILTVLLILGPSAFLLSEWRGLSAWVSTPVIFAIVWGLMYWGFRRNVDKLFDEARYGEIRSFDMMMDDEKIVTNTPDQWEEWLFPLGTLDISESGVRSHYVPRELNASLDAGRFPLGVPD